MGSRWQRIVFHRRGAEQHLVPEPFGRRCGQGHQLLRPDDLSRGLVTRWKILYRSTRQSSSRCVLDYQLPLSGTPHSCFSATIGSSLDALKVWMIDARNAMTMSSMVAAANAT